MSFKSKENFGVEHPKVTYPTGVPGGVNNGSVSFQSLLTAISNCAVPLVHQLIQQTPSLVHEKGWHGQTALHKACLMGDWSICFLLLEAGSDPNALNDFDETPLLYACKRGLASNVHLLVQRNGDLRATDKNGLGVTHHCSQTGSVFVMLYLESQGFSFKELDRNLQSPLHIVCQYGHVDAFKFLIKKQRSSIEQRDIDGNTPLHIAAREGQSYLTWLIISMSRCSILHERNKAGFTPLDLAKQRDKYGHKELIPVLEYYGKQDHSLVPKGPLGLWYSQLLIPGLTYGSLVGGVYLSGYQYQGLVILAGMLVFLWYLMGNYHRMSHISRWPNPIYAGMFGAGIFHSSLLYFVQILPYTMYNNLLTLVCLSLLCALLYFYYKVLTVDPGLVTQSIHDKETGKPMTIVDLCVPHRKIDLLCVHCNIIRSSLTKHCKLCEKCFYQMDHHCLFLLRCVAKGNHSMFVWFITFVMLCMLIFLGNIAMYCFIVYPDKSGGEMLYYMFWSDGWVLSMAVMNIGSLIWGVNLLRYQLSLVSKGYTTVFKGSESILTSNERLLNIMYFLMGYEPFAQDPLFCAQYAV
ncbi:uncharacterized protein LOC132555028 [Ylistrum balloti]|uniref:uncharacterized protein LOC132555028 n=1 Tax=Ylistrum balloti TaxID=509963 RepID=UPI002905EE72|nr:uncharacterized protein LOC132555028 [Ylistrum balloti]